MIIHKQILEITDIQEIKVPENSEIISVKAQNNNLCIWYQFDDKSTFQKECTKTIKIVGTGNEFTNTLNDIFIETVIIEPYVWHVFESKFK